MRTQLKFLFVLPLVSILMAASCKKDDLPKATQTGANTMSASVNGKAWQIKACTSCIGGGTALSVNYDDRDFFGISGQNRDQNIVITIVIKSLKSTGVYELATQANNYVQFYNSKDIIKYYTSNNSRGEVTITKLDLANKIISGTFDFTVKDENNPGNTIKVTDGRFDVKYN